MIIKAKVNGKELVLNARKHYHNGLENVYECMYNGVWVCVEERCVLEKTTSVRTRFDYEGGDYRVGWIKFTAKTKTEVELAREAARLLFTAAGYIVSQTGDAEEVKGKYVVYDIVEVESLNDYSNVKDFLYSNLKIMLTKTILGGNI